VTVPPSASSTATANVPASGASAGRPGFDICSPCRRPSSFGAAVRVSARSRSDGTRVTNGFWIDHAIEAVTGTVEGLVSV
jgi:hypothetical protein